MSYAKRVFAMLLAVFAIAGLAACGGDDNSDTTSTGNAGGDGGGHSITEVKNAVPTITVENGEPVGGVQELEYNAGDQVRFKVDSDVADEIHVHGYDLMKDVPAGGSVSFSFPAEIEGIFEVELEGLKEQIAELRVNP